METFPIVKRKDIAEHGEYRTKRMILEIYDAMAEAERTGVPYASPFDEMTRRPTVMREDCTDERLRYREFGRRDGGQCREHRPSTHRFGLGQDDSLLTPGSRSGPRALWRSSHETTSTGQIPASGGFIEKLDQQLADNVIGGDSAFRGAADP